MQTVFLFLFILLFSSLLYLFLHKKTRISLKYLFQDNLIVAIVSFVSSECIYAYSHVLTYALTPFLIVGFAFGAFMIRFWRTPHRQLTAKSNEIVSPADGKVIYIQKMMANETPISNKNNRLALLKELHQTDVLNEPCWVIGINMTPLDVHKNCAPIDGVVLLNEHTSGKFLSLKDPMAVKENERNTIVIANSTCTLGVVQTASRLVRRIDSYITVGQNVEKGQWVGMIRFGSQVDIILPIRATLQIKIGEQVYAKTTVIGVI
jgi:phosphatidylserine decarboxylase